ncbi:MAG TPA: adenine-specific methyltransferase EcoRI family protein [Desulfuromonadaceae bacterium]
MASELFDQAKRNKADEFYTQLPDIESEMRHYQEQFTGKTILCNCDDPYESNYFKYFAMNFNFLGLRKLIATCYTGSPIAGSQLSMFEIESFEEKCTEARHPYKIEITEVRDENADGAVDLTDVEFLLKNKKNVLSLLNGDGDFRSPECIKLLKEADIVATNPPFSLFREYVAQLVEYDKNFIIIGNKNAITYKEIFKLIRKNRFFVGNRPMAGGMWFAVPDHYGFDKIVDDIKLKNVPSCWFTNFDIAKHHDFLTLYKQYTPDEYPHYDNYDAIDVSKTAEIPYDYDGAMGVPITFLDKYNPDQFEIIALGIVGSIEFSCEKKMEELRDGEPSGKYTINAKGTLYRKYNPDKDDKPPAFKNVETGELYSSIYARIIIKRKGTAQ